MAIVARESAETLEQMETMSGSQLINKTLRINLYRFLATGKRGVKILTSSYPALCSYKVANAHLAQEPNFPYCPKHPATARPG